MRRFVSYIGIILLSLLVSGWGSLLAAACCPHDGPNQPAETAAEDRSGCHARLENAAAHHPGSHHEAAAGTNSKALELPQPQSTGRIALGQPTGACAHCVDRNEIPATKAGVRELTWQQRDGKLIGPTTTLADPPAPVFILKITPTQHAPPGLAGRKYLLLNVFLI